MLYMVTFTINIPPMLAYNYTIHGSYGFGYHFTVLSFLGGCIPVDALKGCQTEVNIALKALCEARPGMCFFLLQDGAPQL